MEISAKDIFSVPSMPSAESAGMAARCRVVMAERTAKDPSLAVLGPSQHREVYNAACVETDVLRTGFSLLSDDYSGGLTLSSCQLPTQPLSHSLPQTDRGENKMENLTD